MMASVRATTGNGNSTPSFLETCPLKYPEIYQAGSGFDPRRVTRRVVLRLKLTTLSDDSIVIVEATM
jgi:hypothetical protein